MREIVMPIILETLRKLLKFKKYATIPEIARIAEVKQVKVLDVLNANSHLISKNGARIVGESVKFTLREQYWKEGKYWREDKANYGCLDILDFNNKQLFDELKTQHCCGGFGDSYTAYYVINTVENQAKLRLAGLVPYKELELDDRLWKE
jgi:hypothetical protein